MYASHVLAALALDDIIFVPQVLAELAVDDISSMAKAGAVPRQRVQPQAVQQPAEEEEEDMQARLDAVRGSA